MTSNKKLKPLTEQVLIGEIVIQIKFAKKAADRLDKASDPIDVWSSIQSILIAGANVSKILWPAKLRETRGKQLRELLGVDDLNILSNRTFRNHFEHYDERIEDWCKNKNSALYKDLSINPFEPTLFSLPQVVHREYNSSEQTLTFRDESINLKLVLDALDEIHEKCRFFVLT